MPRINWNLLLISFALLINQHGFVWADQAMKRYDGAWFSVSYPANFRVKPSLRSFSADGYDSAFFYAPDDKVVFYLFAPQWGGVASDILLQPANEVLQAREMKFSGRYTHIWTTIAAKDGSYRRSYQRTEAADGGSAWVVGVRYDTDEGLARYRAAYNDFKQSIKLYAD